MSHHTHTRLPWAVREAESAQGERFLAVGNILSERSVARVGALATLEEEDVCNANFIAYACNAHHILVAAATAARHALRSGDALEQAKAVDQLEVALGFLVALSPDDAIRDIPSARAPLTRQEEYEEAARRG